MSVGGNGIKLYMNWLWYWQFERLKWSQQTDVWRKHCANWLCFRCGELAGIMPFCFTTQTTPISRNFKLFIDFVSVAAIKSWVMMLDTGICSFIRTYRLTEHWRRYFISMGTLPFFDKSATLLRNFAIYARNAWRPSSFLSDSDGVRWQSTLVGRS